MAPPTGIDAVQKLTDARTLLDRANVFIFDCDGVLWLGETVIDGIPEAIDYLKSIGKRVFFVTNNSTKSREQYVVKFAALGISAEKDEIFSSAFAAAVYLDRIKFKETGKKVYIVGEAGIEEELKLVGVPCLGGLADAGKVPDMKKGGMVHHDHNVGAVVCGYDRNINYYKIQYAQLCINENEGCQFIATNLDALAHATDAQEWAGNASMVGAIRGCTGREPIVVGKPSALLIDYIVENHGVSREEVCMVGDRLDTDILFGTNNGLQSLLVLSGVTTEKKLRSPENTILPDYYADSVAVLNAGNANPN